MSAAASLPRIYLIRHGETEWSASGKHTSRTDVPLTTRGVAQVRLLATQLRDVAFERIFTSPRSRARQTCELLDLTAPVEISEQIREWDYGDYEGLTTTEIRQQSPKWNLFNDGAPGGETTADVQVR